MPFADIRTITPASPEYPPSLNKLHDAPKRLFFRGNADCLKIPAVAVVGTRRSSEHGRIAARSFARAFAQAGLAVISGLAYGIDAAAHEGALAANGLTAAVLGSGIDDASIYPRGNAFLAQRILENGGLLVSENEPGVKPQTWDFPKRNRIIAALARATVVVEAPEKSGALITAKYALEVGHDVYAVPADALRQSARGSNKLLAFGAPPLLDPQELIENIMPGKTSGSGFDLKSFQPHNQDEAELIALLAKGAAHVDELIAATKTDAPTVHATLTALELRGIVANEGNMRYRLAE